MAVYIVTGKLGNGKTLVSVGRIRDKLLSGCIVATNLDLDLAAMCGAQSRNCRVIRVPDKPNAEDLHAIGNGNPTYDESRNGLLVLDECGTWFNSRNWQDKTRKGVNDWFLHARKLGWDVMLIVQDIALVDSQARDAIAEHTVFCRRLDNLHIPIIGTIVKALSGQRLRLPRVHIGKVIYGTSPSDPLSDRWVYRGTSFFKMYDTKQTFLVDYPHSVYTVLPPWYTIGRYQRPRNLEFYMRLTKIYWRRFRSPIALACGALLGVAVTAASAFGGLYQDQRAMLNAARADAARPVQSDGLRAKLAALRITGSGQMGDQVYYEFEDGEGRSISSRDLAAQGVTVQRLTDCAASLQLPAGRVDVYCF